MEKQNMKTKYEKRTIKNLDKNLKTKSNML